MAVRLRPGYCACRDAAPVPHHVRRPRSRGLARRALLLGARVRGRRRAPPAQHGRRRSASLPRCAVRRRAPLAVLAVGLVVIELDNTVLKGLAEAGAFLLGIVIAIYSAGRYARGYSAAVSIVFVGVSIPLAAIEPGTPVALHRLRLLRDVLRWAVRRRSRDPAPPRARAAARGRRPARWSSSEISKPREAVADERSRIAASSTTWSLTRSA